MALAPDTPDTSPRADVLVGKVLDRYRVLEKIGEGGMGAVYRVEHIMLQKHMAMKLLRFELSQNMELVARFQNEAIAAGRIGQENIVVVTDFGRTPDGLVYFVMEELHGDSLADAICSEPRFPLVRTINIAAQCCRALHAAHAAGIVHRDLKPENIVLTTREGVPDFVKILDFGISKIIEMSPNPEGVRLTRAGMIVGTPEYMSPEQAAGKAVDARSDIYSLGIVIFEMLTGKLPFAAENALQMLMQHQTGEVPSFSRVQPGLKVPGKLEKVVRRALAKRPEDRQQSMADLLNELQACAEHLELTQPALRQLGASVRRISVKPGRIAPTRPSSPRVGAEENDALAAGLTRKRSGLWMLGGVAALVALVVLGTMSAGSSRHRKPAPAVPAPAAVGSVPVAAPVLPPVAAAANLPPAAPIAAPIPAAAPASPPITEPTLDLTGEHAAKPVHPGVSRARKLRPATPEPHPRSAGAAKPLQPPDDYQKVDELKKPPGY